MFIWHLIFVFLIVLPPPSLTLFPYTTLFRSVVQVEPLEVLVHTAELFPVVRQHQHHLHVMLRRLRQRSEEHTSELQSPCNLVCRLLLEKKKSSYRPITPSLLNQAHHYLMLWI